jgi:hypothetical protein
MAADGVALDATGEHSGTRVGCRVATVHQASSSVERQRRDGGGCSLQPKYDRGRRSGGRLVPDFRCFIGHPWKKRIATAHIRIGQRLRSSQTSQRRPFSGHRLGHERFHEEDEIADWLKPLADAEGFEPTTSASGGYCVDVINPDLQGVLASTTESGRASEGTEEAVSGHGVPREIVELAQRILGDEDSDQRALELAAWVLKRRGTK